MTDVPVWSLYAYFHGDDGGRDHRREVADWQIEDVVRWARVRGYDGILLTRTKDTARYRPGRPPEGVRHSGSGQSGDDRRTND